MSKAVVVGAVVFGMAACVGGAAAYSGRAVTQRLAQQGRDVSKLFPTVKVVTERERSGLFSSTYDVTYRLGCIPRHMWPGGVDVAGARPTPIEVGLHHDIKHAPFAGGEGVAAAVIDTQLVLPAAFKASLQQLFGEQPPVHVHTRVGLKGDYVSDVVFAGVKVSDPTAGELELAPIQGTVHGSSTGQATVPYHTEIPSIAMTSRVRGQSLSLKVSGIDSRGEFTFDPASSSLLGNNQTEGSIDKVELTGSLPDPTGGPAKPLFATFTGVAFKSRGTLAEGLFSSSGQMSLKGKVNDFNIDRIQASVSMKRIHAKSYQRTMNELFGTMFSCDPALQQAAPFVPDAAKLSAELLAHDPEYALDELLVELNGKRATLSYSVGTRGVTVADLGAGLPEVLSKAVIRAAASIHIALIDQAVAAISASAPAAAAAAGTVPSIEAVHTMIEQFSQLGYLVREGDLVKASASMEHGEVLVNGKPVAMPSFAPPGAP